MGNNKLKMITAFVLGIIAQYCNNSTRYFQFIWVSLISWLEYIYVLVCMFFITSWSLETMMFWRFAPVPPTDENFG